MIASKTETQITASAFISPFGEFIRLYNQTLKMLIGFILAKNPESLLTAESVSFFLKMSNKNGLSRPRDIKENKLESTLKLKYAKISFGYFDTYRKITRKLFIK